MVVDEVGWVFEGKMVGEDFEIIHAKFTSTTLTHRTIRFARLKNRFTNTNNNLNLNRQPDTVRWRRIGCDFWCAFYIESPKSRYNIYSLPNFELSRLDEKNP